LPALALTPLAWTAIRLGAAAALAIYASRRASEPKDVSREQMLDDLPDGVSGHAHRAEAERAVHGAARLRRVLRGPRGVAIEIDASGLGRVRLRRVG
jgi:hypothetical protein